MSGRTGLMTPSLLLMLGASQERASPGDGNNPVRTRVAEISAVTGTLSDSCIRNNGTQHKEGLSLTESSAETGGVP